MVEVLQEEARMPLTNQEGPIGLIVCPSRELARQTYEVILLYAEAIQHETVLPNPKIRVMLCIGAALLLPFQFDALNMTGVQS